MAEWTLNIQVLCNKCDTWVHYLSVYTCYQWMMHTAVQRTIITSLPSSHSSSVYVCVCRSVLPLVAEFCELLNYFLSWVNKLNSTDSSCTADLLPLRSVSWDRVYPEWQSTQWINDATEATQPPTTSLHWRHTTYTKDTKLLLLTYLLTYWHWRAVSTHLSHWCQQCAAQCVYPLLTPGRTSGQWGCLKTTSHIINGQPAIWDLHEPLKRHVYAYLRIIWLELCILYSSSSSSSCHHHVQLQWNPEWTTSLLAYPGCPGQWLLNVHVFTLNTIQ